PPRRSPTPSSPSITASTVSPPSGQGSALRRPPRDSQMIDRPPSEVYHTGQGRGMVQPGRPALSDLRSVHGGPEPAAIDDVLARTSSEVLDLLSGQRKLRSRDPELNSILGRVFSRLGELRRLLA